MKVIAIVSQKGGAGKTTLALNLAVAAERAGTRAAILDLDAQASAVVWADVRNAAQPEVRPCLPQRLGREIERIARDGAEFVVLDTAPHAEGAALAAARAAELVLVPCRPALFDLHAIAASADLARIAAKPAVTVLNAVPSRGRLEAEARAALGASGLDVLDPRLGHRAAFVHALTMGQGVLEFEPKGKASAEVHALFEFLMPARRAAA